MWVGSCSRWWNISPIASCHSARGRLGDVLGISGCVGRVQVVIQPWENTPCLLPVPISAKKGRRDGCESPRALSGYWEVNGTEGRSCQGRAGSAFQALLL